MNDIDLVKCLLIGLFGAIGLASVLTFSNSVIEEHYLFERSQDVQYVLCLKDAQIEIHKDYCLKIYVYEGGE